MGNNIGCISATTSASWAAAEGYPIQTYRFNYDGYKDDIDCMVRTLGND